MAAEDAHYTVLARRFRPQTFADVVGQEHVGQALRNAIRAGRVAHAYLFTGARGVGKTSTARIFAKALNCPNVVDGVPCNQCDICESIAAGSDVDVLEIDGASNRGIDDIRQLRANVGVRSMRSPYKVYIIDEVHMLTKEAFNALLKTLEEPPPNVKFVFCTTEPNKVPETILSRCQRFDFGLIGTATVGARLKQIAEAEGVEVDPEAIELVARRAAGSMRDAQSLFDQLLAFGSERVTPDDVHRLLGTAPDERLVHLVDALIAAEAPKALAAVEEAFAAGVQVGSLSDQLLEYLRDLLIAGLGADGVPLLSVAERLRPELRRQSEQWGVQTVSTAMQVLVETKSRMQRVTYGRALLELALVRICLLEQLNDIGGLIQSLREIPAGTAVATDRPALRPPATPRPAPAPLPADARKKNELSSTPNAVTEASRTADPVPPLDVEPADSAGVSATVSTVPLNEETLQDIWEKVVASQNEVTANHLRNALRVAISGPNSLEIVFPARYSFGRTFCQRPETLTRLKACLKEAVGREIGISISSEGAVEAPVAAAAPPPVNRRTSLESMQKNEFVQQVTSIFGGTLVDVRPVAATNQQEA